VITKPELQKIFRESHIEKRMTNATMKIWEIINPFKQVDVQMRSQGKK
jgi:hypothetical protein